MATIRLLELRNTYKWGGGPDKTILLSAEQHDPNRVEVVVVYVHGAGEGDFVVADKARARGLLFYEVEEHGKLDMSVVSALEKIVEKHGINVIHSHDYKSDLFAYLVRRRLRARRIALISTLHGWALLGLRGAVYWYFDLFVMKRFDHLLAVSHATKAEMVAAGIPSRRVTVIHNGIDTNAWAPSKVTGNPLAREAKLQEAFPVVGYVGRITPEKDLTTWFHTATRVAKEYPTAQFVIVGEGKTPGALAELKSLADSLGIIEKVHFLGYRDDLVPIYALFDIFLLSSRREGICNSLLEAMAMEVPVVATSAGGTRELVVHDHTGYMLQPGDAEGLSKAVCTLAADDGLRRTMGKAGRKRIEEQFSFEKRLRRIEDLYENLLGSRGPFAKRLPLGELADTPSTSANL